MISRFVSLSAFGSVSQPVYDGNRIEVCPVLFDARRLALYQEFNFSQLKPFAISKPQQGRMSCCNSCNLMFIPFVPAASLPSF